MPCNDVIPSQQQKQQISQCVENCSCVCLLLQSDIFHRYVKDQGCFGSNDAIWTVAFFWTQTGADIRQTNGQTDRQANTDIQTIILLFYKHTNTHTHFR